MPKASHQVTKELGLLDGEDCSIVYSRIKYLTLSATVYLYITGYLSTFLGWGFCLFVCFLGVPIPVAPKVFFL